MTAISELIAGYERFRDHFYINHKDLIGQLATEGQFPKAAVISCCDSRVQPGIIMDCLPGELFIIRNVANLVPAAGKNDYYHGAIAALEYAVNVLKVESILVLGHSCCGGIQALVDNNPEVLSDSFIGSWLKQAEKSRDEIMADQSLTDNQSRYHACELQSIVNSLENLMTYPWIEEKIQSGELVIEGWHYNIETAKINRFDADCSEFVELN